MKYSKFITLLILIFIFSCSGDDTSSNLELTEEPNPALNKLAVGDSANDFLATDDFPKLVIEIISVEGHELSNAVISDFEDFLDQRLNKSQGITIKKTTVQNPGLDPYSTEDLRSYEDQVRTEFNSLGELTLYIFLAEGSYAENNVLGLAYRNTSCAIMSGRIKELTGGLGQPSESLVMQTVLRHEIGHLIGLVNIGTPMQSDHQDEANGRHCDVESCLMYYAVESGDFIANLIGENEPPGLDSQCLADLAANGGK